MRDERKDDEFVDCAVNTSRLDDDADLSVMTSEAPLVSKRASCDLTFTQNHIFNFNKKDRKVLFGA